MDLKSLEVWFVTGSQHLYGPEALDQVARNSRLVVDGLNASARLPIRVVFKPVVTTPDAILQLCRAANAASECAGLVCWMHTFSPAKMWIAGLLALDKPLAHLHTQFSRDLPWATIDMDFMNLNQAAHGDREFGHICARLHQPRKVVVGHWQDSEVQDRLAVWVRAAAALVELRGLKIARFGDNMRQVAVTEGDKVEAQARLGVQVNGYGVGDLAARVRDVSEVQVDRLVKEYDERYTMADALKPSGDRRKSLRAAARIELGLRSFLEEGGFGRLGAILGHQRVRELRRRVGVGRRALESPAPVAHQELGALLHRAPLRQHELAAGTAHVDLGELIGPGEGVHLVVQGEREIEGLAVARVGGQRQQQRRQRQRRGIVREPQARLRGQPGGRRPGWGDAEEIVNRGFHAPGV